MNTDTTMDVARPDVGRESQGSATGMGVVTEMEQDREHTTDATAQRQWRRSSSCPEIDCVEVRFLADAVLMRDSQDQGNQLRFTVAEWGSFLRTLRNDAIPATASDCAARIGSAGIDAAGKQAGRGGLVTAAADGGGDIRC